jgi:hypothetical protein
MVPIKYRCLCLYAVRMQVHCRITAQQMWRLIKNTNPSPRRRGDSISKHIDGL